MAVTTTLDYQGSPTRTLAFTVDQGDGSKAPVYGRDLRNVPAFKLASTTPNNEKGGADLCYHTILTVPVGAPVDVDLQAFVDIAGRTARSFARVKSIEFWLLGSDDTTGGLTGNACSGVTVKPAAANGFLMFLAGTAPELTLGNGDNIEWKTRLPGGKVVDASHKVLTFTDLDGVIDGHLLVIINGGST
jgi:hypothetical protein